MKKKILKVLALVACAVLLVVGSIAGTYAFLTSQSDVVTNTFTVGNVTIKLDETDVDLYGVKDGDSRVIENDYKLIPGHTYVKDPTIHVAKGSEQCILLVEITNEIAAIETSIAGQLATNGWEKLSGNVWYKIAVVDARNVDTDYLDVKVFEKITIAASVDNATLATYADKTVTVKAYAVQADGITADGEVTAAEATTAWEAFGTSGS